MKALLSVPASLPSLGHVLTTSSEGEGTIRFAISPADVAEVATALAALGGTTFYLTLVAKPERARRSALAIEPCDTPSPHEVLPDANPAKPARRRRSAPDRAAREG